MDDAAQPNITIPPQLLPADGRFGSGPSKVRPAQVEALAASRVLGTSHRQAAVLDLVARIQARLAELYRLPPDYRVVLGLGGASAFWDIASLQLIARRSQHCVFGEFGGKFASAVASCPHVAEPDVRRADPPGVALPEANPDVDVYAWAHNETSTGACVPVRRPRGASADQLVVVDGTSAAAGIEVDPAQFDAYYFSPQKGLGADGGLWFALLSPAAIERCEALSATDRWVPASLSLAAAIRNSAKAQTANTPAIATLIMIDAQLEWIAAGGGLAWSAARAADSSSRLYRWAEASDVATPFVAPEYRSPVVATIAFEGVDAGRIAAQLRANGIVDVEPYRGLGGNLLRVGTFPNVEPDDVEALTACIDFVVARL